MHLLQPLLFINGEDEHQLRSWATSSSYSIQVAVVVVAQTYENNIITVIIIDVGLSVNLLLKAPPPFPFFLTALVYTFSCPAAFLSLVWR